MESAKAPVRKGNFLAARILIVIATVFSIVSIFAVWTNRQLLDPGNWSKTSTELLQNQTVRDATAQYLTDQIYKNVNVQQQLEKALPDQAQVLAGPAATELRSLAQKGIAEALGTTAVQDVWRAANKALATQVVNVIDQKNTGFLQYQGNNVQLDLRQAAIDIGDKVGLKAEAQKIPPGAASVTVFTAKEIGQVRTVARFLEAVAVIFPLLALLFYVLAVAVSRGRRRRAVMNCSISLIIAALIAVATRGIAEGIFLDAIVPPGAARPPAEATWNIATEMLGSIAGNTIFLAFVVLLFTTLGSQWGWARRFREWVAPWTNSRQGIAYGVAFALLLLFLVWGPVPAAREWVTVLIFIALTGAGVWGLREMTLSEFPDASEDEAVARLATSWEEFRSTISSGVSRGATAARGTAKDVRERAAAAAAGRSESRVGEATQRMAAVPDSGPSEAATVEQPVASIEALERLAKLHASGALTDAEFAQAKTKLL